MNYQLIEEEFTKSVFKYLNISSDEECSDFFNKNASSDFVMDFDGDCILNKEQMLRVCIKLWLSFPDFKFNVSHLGGIYLKFFNYFFFTSFCNIIINNIIYIEIKRDKIRVNLYVSGTFTGIPFGFGDFPVIQPNGIKFQNDPEILTFICSKTEPGKISKIIVFKDIYASPSLKNGYNGIPGIKYNYK